MNTLCHLCLDLNSPEFMLGHFLGDFAKGPVDALPYPEKVLQGIRAHRRVDATGETHAFLRYAKELLPKQDRRYGGILVDLYGDYLLHRCWEDIMQDPWSDVSYKIQSFLRSPPHPFPPEAAGYANFLLNHNLLAAYRNPNALAEIFDRVGQRLRKPVAFSPLLKILREKEPDFIRDFPAYFSDMKEVSDGVNFDLPLNGRQM